MRSVACLLLPALMLGGCSFLVPRTNPPAGASGGGYYGQAPSPPPATIPTGGDYTPAATGLQGQWRVSAIDGKAVELPEPITLAIDPAAITVHSGCIGMAWDYADNGGVLTTSSAPVISCRRGYFPQEQTLSHILSDRVQVSHSQQGGLELSGSGHRVLLFRQ